MHLILCKRRLRWPGHVRYMEDSCIPNDLLHGELATGCRSIVRAALRFKNVCKRDLKLTGIDTESWEALALDRDGWCHAVRSGVKKGEERTMLQLKERRERRKARQGNAADTLHSEFVCVHCGRDCHARIGLLSHSRRCSQQSQWLVHTIVSQDRRIPTTTECLVLSKTGPSGNDRLPSLTIFP